VSDKDELPIFRPRIGGGRKPSSSGGVQKFRNVILASARRRGPRSREGPAKAPDPSKRRVVVKARYVKMTASGKKVAALHLKYIERDGVEKDGSKGVLYDANGPARRDDFLEPRAEERHQFRFILSPEDGEQLDMTAYVRSFMSRVERDMGQKLEWAAVNHYNTDNPHAHIVIRGVDRDGREVRMDRAYISKGLRERAQELATEELGPRTERAIARQRDREVAQDRFTSLDREIERHLKGDEVHPRQPGARRSRGAVDDGIVIARLEYLVDLNLAERSGPASWRLAPGWQAELRELGTHGDIIKEMHRALSGDPSRYRIVSPGGEADNGQAIHGRLARKGLADELKDSYYAVVETPDGQGYYVPIDQKAAEHVREGDMVSFGSREHAGSIRKEDERLADQVRRPGPAWIDRVNRKALAPYGFGRELQSAVSDRDNAVRGFGIDPADPRRFDKLRDVECAAVGRRIAEQTGETFVPAPPERFRGQLKIVERRPGEGAYAVVTDGARFAVVPLTRDAQASEGRMVTLSRDPQGRMQVRAPDKDRRIT